MFQNQQFAGNPMQPGFAYGAKPMPRCTQPITPELSKLLHQESDDLNVKIDKVSSLRNQCTHKEPGTGQLALVYNPDGTVTCRTCGETFHLIEDPDSEIQAATDRLIDILQTTKVMYLDIPEEFVKEYFQMISLLKNLPKIYHKAANNFSMYESYSGAAYPTTPVYNAFQAVHNIMSVNPMMGTQPMYGGMQPQQPMYPGMYQQPAAPQQPMYPGQVTQQPSGYMAQSVQPGWTQQPVMVDPANPMAYGAPTAAPAPAPVQAPTGEITQTKDFTV